MDIFNKNKKFIGMKFPELKSGDGIDEIFKGRLSK